MRRRLERWSPTAFMLGGASIALALPLIFLARAAVVFVLVAALFLVGVAAIIVGSLGLRPRLAQGAPKLARTGGVVVVVCVGLAVIASLVIVTLALAGGPLGMDVPGAPEFGLATPPLFGAIVLGHAIFGIASWRTGTPSRPFGALLVALAVLWIASFVVGMRSAEFDAWDLLAFEVPAVGTIVAGYLLRSAPGEATSPSPHGGPGSEPRA